jgi:hypothetical protein
MLVESLRLRKLGRVIWCYLFSWVFRLIEGSLPTYTLWTVFFLLFIGSGKAYNFAVLVGTLGTRTRSTLLLCYYFCNDTPFDLLLDLFSNRRWSKGFMLLYDLKIYNYYQSQAQMGWVDLSSIIFYVIAGEK